MSLMNFVSQVTKDVVFDSKFLGIKAVYSRRIENEESDYVETKTAELFVSPQGNYVVASKDNDQIGGRVNVIWAKTADLKFGDEPFLPQTGDLIEYEANGESQKFMVTPPQKLQKQSSFGQQSTFAYEDGLMEIIKIMTIKQ